MLIISKMARLFWCRSIHTVKPHIPLIHFPKRFPMDRSGVSEKLTSVAVETKLENSKMIGPDLGAIDDSELPLKYRRNLILSEEILYIERGGPD